MPIRIKTNKVWLNGERHYRVVDIEMLTKEELPYEYVNKCDYLFKRGDCIFYQEKDKNYRKCLFTINGLYPQKEFWKRFKTLKKCGYELFKIKNKWKGRKVFEV